MRLNVLLVDYCCGICYGPLMDVDGSAVCRHYPIEHSGANFVLGRTARREIERAHDLGAVLINLITDCNRTLAIECDLAAPLKQGAELQAAFENNRRLLHGDDTEL